MKLLYADGTKLKTHSRLNMERKRFFCWAHFKSKAYRGTMLYVFTFFVHPTCAIELRLGDDFFSHCNNEPVFSSWES